MDPNDCIKRAPNLSTHNLRGPIVSVVKSFLQRGRTGAFRPSVLPLPQFAFHVPGPSKDSNQGTGAYKILSLRYS